MKRSGVVGAYAQSSVEVFGVHFLGSEDTQECVVATLRLQVGVGSATGYGVRFRLEESR